VPATVRDDPVVVSIATGGTAPALSRHLREQIETDVEGAGKMAELLGELRAELKASEPDAETRRRAILRVLESSAVWKGLRTDTEKGRREAERIVEEVTK
jgi:precorrin-2 dehydrogenase/sirohydrochlorin ferrochelatase